jgi:hypothetical protein
MAEFPKERSGQLLAIRIQADRYSTIELASLADSGHLAPASFNIQRAAGRIGRSGHLPRHNAAPQSTEGNRRPIIAGIVKKLKPERAHGSIDDGAEHAAKRQYEEKINEPVGAGVVSPLCPPGGARGCRFRLLSRGAQNACRCDAPHIHGRFRPGVCRLSSARPRVEWRLFLLPCGHRLP